MPARLSKPKVFIGSSKERMNLAKAVQQNLSNSGAAFALPWYQGVFEGNDYTLDELLTNAVKQCDYAVFIFHPDDISLIRETSYAAVRDNVILELGMFYGRLGRQRTFFIVPRQLNQRTPSDLYGLNPLLYDWDSSFEQESSLRELSAAVGVACNTIQERIGRLGFFQDPAQQLAELSRKHNEKLQLARFQNESLKAVQCIDINSDLILSGLTAGFDKKCDILDTEVRISGASLYELGEGNTFTRIGRHGHAVGATFGEASIDSLSRVLGTNELLLSYDEEQSSTLVDEVEYQLFVPIDRNHGILIVIHFRVNSKLDGTYERHVMNDLYAKNEGLFAFVKRIFGRRVSNGEAIQR